MGYKYYVVGKIFDNAKGEAEVITAEEAFKKNYINGLQEEHETYTLYVDGFDSMKEAKEFAQDY